MRYDDEYEQYDYNYDELAENADELYYDDGTDEPWMDTDSDVAFEENEQYQYDSYYHDITDEIVDD